MGKASKQAVTVQNVPVQNVPVQASPVQTTGIAGQAATGRATGFTGYGATINNMLAAGASKASILAALGAQGCKNPANKLNAHLSWLKKAGVVVQPGLVINQQQG